MGRLSLIPYRDRLLAACIVAGLTLVADPPTGLAQQVIGKNAVVTGRDINVGVPPEQLEALIRDKTHDLEVIPLLKEKLDLNQRQIRAALDILGEANVLPERLAAKLAEIAGRFKALQTAATARSGDDPKLMALKADVQRAIQEGDLAKPDGVLAAVEKLQTEAFDRLALNAAETSAERGELAPTRLRYAEAAQHFAIAASQVPSGQDDKRLDDLDREAEALYRQGSELGDNDAIWSAINRYHQILALRSRDRVPLQWATTQYNLGNALSILGVRESNTAHLKEAIQAYREALKERTRDRVPLDWAETQNNLGAALRSLGQRESGTAYLKEAVQAYREALKEATRHRVPLIWAATQYNLGNVLYNLGNALSIFGEGESSTARLEEAVAAYREALKEQTRDRTPFDWAKTQDNLGTALRILNERKALSTPAR